MKVLRTPDERFAGLKDYPFAPNYLNVAAHTGTALRMHYVDEGPRDGAPVLMLHGEPSWSYLYRHMIPVCVAAGHRVVAPDLVGFGKSDKLAQIGDYSYQSHMDWITEFITALDLRNITLVCQDWGSLLGLRLAAEQQQRFARIVVGNGMLPTGEMSLLASASGVAPFAFLAWRTFARFSPWFPIGKLVHAGSLRALDADEMAAYDAPYPDASYLAAARAFPRLVPITPNDPAGPANKAAWEVLSRWQKPFLTCFSNGDPITRGFDTYLQQRVPGAQGLPHRRIRGGHFLQENSPKEFAGAVNALIAATPQVSAG